MNRNLIPFAAALTWFAKSSLAMGLEQNNLFNFMAQTEVTQNASCSIYHDRIKNEKNIFYATQAQNLEFKDPEFNENNMIKHPTLGSKQGDVLDSQGEFGFVSSLDILHP